MKLYEYPTVNRDLKDLSLRQQMEARLRQISSGYYTEKSITTMNDYALLTAFEVSIIGIAHETSEEEWSEAFDAGMKFAQERMLEQINEMFGSQPETFTMKEGELIASSEDWK